VARNRSLSRARVLGISVALTLPLGLLIGFSPGSRADEPIEADFVIGPWKAVDLPAYPATFVASNGNATYHSLTVAGTAALEYGIQGTEAPAPEVLEMWADDEPYRHAGPNGGLDRARHITAGDLDPAPGPTNQPGVELAWVTDTTLAVSRSQQSGFLFRDSTAIEPGAVDVMILEHHEIVGGYQQPGRVLVAYPHKIEAYVLAADGELTRLTQWDGSPFVELDGQTLLAAHHRPVHETYGTRDDVPSADDFVYLTVEGDSLVLNQASGDTTTRRSVVARAPAGGDYWVSGSVSYDRVRRPQVGGDDLFPVVTVRHQSDAPGDGHRTWVDGVELDGPDVPTDLCAGAETAQIDVEVWGDEFAFACANVLDGTATGGRDELRQSLYKGSTSWPNMGHNYGTWTRTVGDQQVVTSPQPQIVLPCVNLLLGVPGAGSTASCSSGFDFDETNWSMGHPAVDTYVSAGTSDALASYLVADGSASFTVPAAPGTSTLPAATVRLPLLRTQLYLNVTNNAEAEIRQSDPVPVAFLAAPPQVAGAGQEADPPEFASTSGSGSSSGESTETTVGVGLGINYEDPLGAFGFSLQAEVERGVTTGTQTSVNIHGTEEFRGLMDRNVVVYNSLRYKRFEAEVAGSSTGVGLYDTEPLQIDLPIEGVTSAASVENLRTRFSDFREGGHLAEVVDQVFDHEVGNPGTYRSWGDQGQSVEQYCDGALSPDADRDLHIADPRVPPNPFMAATPDPPPMPDIKFSNTHQVLVGTGNAEGATFGIETSQEQSRVETWGLEVSAEVRAAYVEASVSAGFAWSKEWTNSLSQGVEFASYVGHIPGNNDFLQDEEYDWRSFMCQKTVDTDIGPVTAWVLNYTVDHYDGSGGLEELSDLNLTEPTGSIAVSDPTPELKFEQQTGTVREYLWQLEAVNVNDVHSGQVSFDDPADSNANREVENSVSPTRDLLEGELYRWRVTATDFFGNTVRSEWEYFRAPGDVQSGVPQAVIGVGTTTVDAGQKVVFENDSPPSRAGTTYTWDFGDGSAPVTSTSPTLEHTFVMGGTFVVKLTATNSTGSSTDQVRITVTPTLGGDSFQVGEDQELDEQDGVLANDEGATEAAIVRTADHGGLTFAANGTFTYQPDPDFCGQDNFFYTAGGAYQTATIAVACVNDPPLAGDDRYALQEDGSLAVDLLANDTDVDDGDTLSLTTSTPAHGKVTKSADGRFTYEPEADWCGDDAFNTTVTDGHGGTDTATSQVTVDCVNDPPKAGSDLYVLDEDGQLTVDLLANDTDPDGDSLSATLGSPRHGVVRETGDGRFTYKPDADYCGSDAFTLTVSDGKGGSDMSRSRVTVVCVNDGPVGSDDEVFVDEDRTITIDPVGNDPDGDTVTVTVQDPDHGEVADDADGNLVYTPDPDYCGSDDVKVTLSDGNGGVTRMTVHVTVECINDAPVGVDDSATTLEDQRLILDPTVNDTDVDGDAGAMTLHVVTDPAHGDARLLKTGELAYVPDANYCGPDELSYRPVDGDGAAADRATAVTVAVRCVNDRPRAVRDGFFRFLRNGKVEVNRRGVLRNDRDVDSPMRAKLLRGPGPGVVYLHRDGSFVYRLRDRRHLRAWVSFTYKACDAQTCSAERRAVLHLR
jgi:hypothetical protein